MEGENERLKVIIKQKEEEIKDIKKVRTPPHKCAAFSLVRSFSACVCECERGRVCVCEFMCVCVCAGGTQIEF